MIQEIALNDTEYYSNYSYPCRYYERGIKADICLKVDDLETYYSKQNEEVYVHSGEVFEIHGISRGEKIPLTNGMLNELVEYLQWENWSINVHYYDYEDAMLIIKKLS